MLKNNRICIVSSFILIFLVQLSAQDNTTNWIESTEEGKDYHLNGSKIKFDGESWGVLINKKIISVNANIDQVIAEIGNPLNKYYNDFLNMNNWIYIWDGLIITAKDKIIISIIINSWKFEVLHQFRVGNKIGNIDKYVGRRIYETDSYFGETEEIIQMSFENTSKELIYSEMNKMYDNQDYITVVIKLLSTTDIIKQIIIEKHNTGK